MIKVLEESIKRLIISRDKGEFKIPSSYTHEANQMLFNNIDLFEKYKMAYEVEKESSLSSKEGKNLIRIIEDNDNEIINEMIFNHMVSEIADKNL
ncbi:hypothetical protein ABFP60_14690 [Clostridioides difficile]